MIVATRQSLMFRARSYMAFVLSPQLSATDLDAKGIASLVTSLNERHIRVQTEFLSDCAASHDVIRKGHCRAA
jgi:hypothetical protein